MDKLKITPNELVVFINKLIYHKINIFAVLNEDDCWSWAIGTDSYKKYFGFIYRVKLIPINVNISVLDEDSTTYTLLIFSKKLRKNFENTVKKMLEEYSDDSSIQ